MTESRIFKRGKRVVAAAAVATVGMLALGASAAPAQAQDISVTPDSVDFGQVLVGDVSHEEILTFTNQTGADVVLDVTAKSSGPGGFSLGPTLTCEIVAEPFTVIVPSSGSCEAGFVFEPRDVGLSTVTIVWLHEGALVDVTEFSGEGVTELPAPTCEPPSGPVSGPLHQLGTRLGPLGASMVNLAKDFCAAGL